MIKAVLFDLDGTLVDTEYHSVMKKVRVLEQNGIEMTPELFQKVCGRKLQTTIGEILPEYSEEVRQKILQDYYGQKRNDDYANLKLPGADETLQILHEKGYRMALVSTNLRKSLEKALDETGWRPYFDLYIGLEDVVRTKPDPQVYINAMEAFGINADEAVIIEDSRVGLDSAIAAGCRVICRKENRYQVNQEGADYYVDTLAEIPELLKEIN